MIYYFIEIGVSRIFLLNIKMHINFKLFNLFQPHCTFSSAFSYFTKTKKIEWILHMNIVGSHRCNYLFWIAAKTVRAMWHGFNFTHLPHHYNDTEHNRGNGRPPGFEWVSIFKEGQQFIHFCCCGTFAAWPLSRVCTSVVNSSTAIKKKK